VLCRTHHRRGDLGPSARARTIADQLSFDG